MAEQPPNGNDPAAKVANGAEPTTAHLTIGDLQIEQAIYGKLGSDQCERSKFEVLALAECFSRLFGKEVVIPTPKGKFSLSRKGAHVRELIKALNLLHSRIPRGAILEPAVENALEMLLHQIKFWMIKNWGKEAINGKEQILVWYPKETDIISAYDTLIEIAFGFRTIWRWPDNNGNKRR